ncbi:MAG: HIT family protein [Amnibacterium sp.]
MTPDECVFCAIAAGRAQASVVHEDETALAFLDLNPVTQGHLLVVPRTHGSGLEDVDDSSGEHVWSVARRMATALRRSALQPEGINLLLCDGAVAFQTVFHLHLHVIPRYAGDGWSIVPTVRERERSLLDRDARLIRDALGR